MASENGIEIHCKELLNITFLRNSEIDKVLEINGYNLLFSSKNAIKAIEHLKGKLSVNKAYCISGATQEAAIEAGFEVIASAKNGKSLAQEIIAKGESSVLHCCTENRRNEIEYALVSAAVQYKTLNVYKKDALGLELEDYDAYFFYSPSQVAAFLLKNELPDSAPVFCIGDTTAEYVKAKSKENVYAAEQPLPRQLIEMSIKYFKR